ncbi:type II secretion system protein GspD [Candidatus Seribacter sulfatis]|uniref:type II secretion system protein GspD n=1 Tax=Candidatus Seribacter sulfatis TaxID=3381756 RepID=UPI00389ADBA7
MRKYLSPSFTSLFLILVSTLFGQNAENTRGVEIEMKSERIRLSYVDPSRCAQLLNFYGINIGDPKKPIDPTQLPVVVAVPETAFHETIPDHEKVFPKTETDPINELLLFFDAAAPEKAGRVRRIIQEQIDLPARKIMIEAMVLEISSQALDQLGVEWDFNSGGEGISDNNFIQDKLDGTNDSLVLGKIAYPAAGSAQLDATITNVFREFNVRLQALVEDGSAQVLSRPSVLTLDNRMAFINVSERIPIANTKFVKDYVSAVDFRDVVAGIQLAVRPRINRDGTEVSLQINAAVSARVPGKDEKVLGKDSIVLATAPTLSIREVKTYARIANDTPFIVGGLIAKDSEQTIRKVPLLGDIPFLGALFRSKNETGQKREVIIVITPSVLPEDSPVHAGMPKDDDLFDQFGHRLFRDAYRIRAEDTFDLRYLTENKGLQQLQSAVDRVVTDHPQLSTEYPYEKFAHDAVPGEGALVRRQIYEVLKRQQASDVLDVEKLIFFEKSKDRGDGIKVRFLAEYLRDVAPFVLAKKQSGKAFGLCFRMHRNSLEINELLHEPVPEIKIVDCPDDQAWRSLLLESNKRTPGTAAKQVIFLRNLGDLNRLKNAILMKKIISLNASDYILKLKNFTRGRLLRMPTVREDDVELIDADVATCYYHSELYYSVLEESLESDYAALKKVLSGTDYESALKETR